GGPVNKMRLATREITQVLQKDDKRLNDKRNYIYFPMVSPCRRLIAFAASPDSHDHFEANYDLYVAHINPELMEIIGNPVRYTTFKGTDRYPDVFREELPLGSQYVEGPTEITFDAGEKGTWHWHITGGADYDGRTIKHAFQKPGEYWIEAQTEPSGEKRRGYVFVSPSAPPLVEGSRREGKDGIVVDFDEEVESSQAVVKLGNGKPVQSWQLMEGNLSLSVKLPPEAREEESLVIEGFRDKAQMPNRMASTSLRVPLAAWPSSDEGLVFVWENVKGLTKLPNGNPCTVVPQGLAFWDERGAMKLRGGWFDAPEAGELVSSECRKTHEVSLELVLTPQGNIKDKEDRRILSLANNHLERNLMIGQRGPRLFLWMRTPENGPGGNLEETFLAVVQKDYPHHLVMAYGKDKLTVFVDGQQVYARNRIKGDFSNWEQMKMRFGASMEGTHSWRGMIERVLIFNRKLSDEEVSQHANSSIVMSGKRLPMKEAVVMARLVKASPVPPLQEFQPYTEALVRNLYEITEVVEGGGNGPTQLDLKPRQQVTVTQWSWMGAQALASQSLKVGDVQQLRLHRSEDHRELESLFVKDSLNADFDAEALHDAGEWMEK
ncbi:MAG: LamG-like jellyroll fold domain-containing protein, partial [Verrucomicrobium sp.]